MARTVLTTMPGSAPLQRLQVELEQADSGPLTICLCEQHYAEGIGWFTQRSMQLDARQWALLRKTLGSDQVTQAIADEAEEGPTTLPFPGPSSPKRFRQAVGDGSE